MSVGTDLVTIAADPTSLDRVADPGAYVVAVCDHARAWLADLIAHGDIEQLVDVKSTAAVVEKLTTAKKLGHEAEMSAAEIVRRAERGIGLAIRKGQEAGEIRGKGQRGPAKDSSPGAIFKPGPGAFASTSEWRNAKGGIVDLTDDVTDEQFEEAITAAKAEQNLSRANVVRKVKGEPTPKPADGKLDKSRAAIMQREAAVRKMAREGHTSSQIGASLGISDDAVRKMAARIAVEIPADAVVGRGRNRKFDADRIVSTLVHDLEGHRMSIGLIDFTELDREQIQTWVDSLAESIRSLQALKTALVKESNRDES